MRGVALRGGSTYEKEKPPTPHAQAAFDFKICMTCRITAANDWDCFDAKEYHITHGTIERMATCLIS